jgi:lipopolysaccharide export LptBFGC system permease protein LptF
MIKKNGRNIGFIISLCIILINYTAIIFAIDLSKNEIVPIFITMWSPSIITTVLGIYLFIKTIKN